MPMFDDPRKELQRLQEQLLAQEAEENPGEAWSGEEYQPDFDQELEDILRLIRDEKTPPVSQEPPMRNYANNYGRGSAPVEEEEEEGDALYCDEYESPKKKRKKEKGIRGLVFLAILETLGIVAIAAWWVKFLWL